MKRAKSPPPTGDVTIVFLGKVYQGTWRGGTVRHATSKNLIQANVKRSDEGITWIRGHHDPRSKAARALRAAYALRLSDRPDRSGATVTVRVRGVPFPIAFADYTHDRLYQKYENDV